jgi:hypothetical protein
MKTAFSNTQIETLFDQSFNHGLTPFIEHPSLYKYGLPLLEMLLEARIEWEQFRPIAEAKLDAWPSLDTKEQLDRLSMFLQPWLGNVI